jgi:hypothetical protein
MSEVRTPSDLHGRTCAPPLTCTGALGGVRSRSTRTPSAPVGGGAFKIHAHPSALGRTTVYLRKRTKAHLSALELLILPKIEAHSRPGLRSSPGALGGSGTGKPTMKEGVNMAENDDPYYCPHCGVSPCAGLTEDC